MPLILLIIITTLSLLLVLFVLPNLIISVILYRLLLVRTSNFKWNRNCKKMKGKEHVEMYERGVEWATKNENFREPVSIYNNGLNLYGEFFNFGFKKAVIIISGHSEGCKYSYYYAIPYKVLGYNVLVIDNRCTGLSDGKYLTFGLREYSDILLWGTFLHQNYNIDSILLHGICMGAATALYALTSDNVPYYYTGMIADGMYTTFYEIFKNHIITFKQPTFPVLQIVFFMIRKISKVDAINNGPIYSIEKLQKPILFLHSYKDTFSLPDEVEEVYEKCKAPKQIIWFNKGTHSHIRINNEAAYDNAISNFCNSMICL